MRILEVIQRYWPHPGGSERLQTEVSERLARDGHQVTVLTTDAWDLEYFWDGSKRRIATVREERDGVDIHRFPVRHLPCSTLAFAGLRRLASELSRLPVDTASVLPALASRAPWVPGLSAWLDGLAEPYDVIHGSNICFESLLIPAARAATRLKAAFLVTPLAHLGEYQDDRVRRYYTMRHQLDLLRDCDGVMVMTETERAYLAERGVHPALLEVTGVGVDAGSIEGGLGARFRSKYGVQGPLVCALGAAAFDKGTVHVLEAARELWSGGEEITLVIAGPIMEQFQRHYQSLAEGERQRCRLLGLVSEEDKKDLLAAADVLAMPSRTDSFGTVFLEAWIYEKPVIGARAGGIPDVVTDGVDGFVVDFGDVGALVARLRLLLRDRELAAALGRRGREKALTRYSWDVVYPRIRAVYERAGEAAARRRLES